MTKGCRPHLMLWIAIALSFTIVSCDRDQPCPEGRTCGDLGQRGDLGIVWEAATGLDFEVYGRPNGAAILHGGFLYLPVYRREGFGVELIKFDAEDGTFVDRWVADFRTGLSSERAHVRDGHLYFVRREAALHAINLATMESAWDMEIEGGARLDFQVIGREAILRTGRSDIIAVDLESRAIRRLGSAPIIDPGVFGINPTPVAYVDEGGAVNTVSLDRDGDDVFLVRQRPLATASSQPATVYRQRVPGISRPSARPFAVQVTGDFAVVNDVRHVSVHRLSDGTPLWDETFATNGGNIGDPNLQGNLLLFGRSPVSMRDVATGRSGHLPAAHDNFEISHDYALRIGDHLWFGPYPFDLRTGTHLPGWQAYRGPWGDPELPFRGLPTPDEAAGVLYFVDVETIHCVRLPE